MTRSTDPVRRIADQYVAELAAHEPDAAQAAGLPSPGPLADIGPEWLQRKYALQGETLAALDAVPAEAGDAALRAALAERLERERLLFDTGFTPRLVAGLASPVHLIRYAIEGLHVTADDAGEELLARIEAVPHAVAQYIASLRWARDHADRFSGSSVAPVRQLDTLAGQLDLWVGSDWFGSIPIDDAVDAATRARARLAADRAHAAVTELAGVLRDELRPVAPTVDGVGEQVYADVAAAMLGARIDLVETYAYGWSRARATGRRGARARRRTRRHRGRPGPQRRRPPRRRSALSARRRRRRSGSWLERRVGETTAALGSAFDLPPGIRDVECIVAEASTGVVYYTPAPPDGSAPSRIVWTIPSGVPVAATWQEVTSVHHEGLPGHHLQFAATASYPELHPWQRHLCHIHGYAEGWAHYAEQLADELGLIRDPAERLGLLLGQIWRSVRIVADIGLHTGWAVPPNPLVGETDWSPELAQRMLVDLALVEPHLAGFEVDRYLGWPGQALAFKVGARLWNEAREARASADGEAFSLRDFHRDALALGPMGLEPLRARLLGESVI